ncbi:hypothetical protein EDD18DRAFT_1109247 [Armillaria luteobubalina]|uniref:Uncharacterized protein n=1 Tax=Armillaria luteobubalina TaxID=153913 RepID=A0AA39TJT7_9AGAR|nr:hypothetical protein EDD18DRAFT_1109247 [Armillaria luteobubalina]
MLQAWYFLITLTQFQSQCWLSFSLCYKALVFNETEASMCYHEHHLPAVKEWAEISPELMTVLQKAWYMKVRKQAEVQGIWTLLSTMSEGYFFLMTKFPRYGDVDFKNWSCGNLGAESSLQDDDMSFWDKNLL